MSEALSTTTTFNLPIDDILREAFDMIGGEHVNAYDAASARRSLNLLLLDLMNREYPIGNLKKYTVNLQDGVSEYDLDTEVVAIIDLNYKDVDGISQQLMPESLLDFFNITNTARESQRPSTYVFDVTSSRSPKMRIWPTPNATAATGTIEFWGVRKMKDVTSSYQLVDLSYKYLPAIPFGLAYYMSFKREGFPLDKRAEIKTEYMDMLNAAFSSDRENIGIHIYPDLAL